MNADETTTHHKPMIDAIPVGCEFTWGPHPLARESKMFSGAVRGKVDAGNGYTLSIIGGCDRFYLTPGEVPEKQTYEVAIMHTHGGIVDPFREGDEPYGYQTIEEVQALIKAVMALPAVTEEEAVAAHESHKRRLEDALRQAQEVLKAREAAR
jgi:hypothetical protein